jgi:hypothetical protein
MDSTIKRSQRDYSFVFKLSVVDQVERGELTYRQAQKRYGVQNGRKPRFVEGLVFIRRCGRLCTADRLPRLGAMLLARLS